jgi:glycosyltransferase involved in cell wall biosynthesis
LADRETLTREFGRALCEIFQSPKRLDDMGHRAQEYALRYYSWEAKALKFMDVYRWVCGQASTRPDFFA